MVSSGGPTLLVCDEVPRTRLAKHSKLFFQERGVGVRLISIVVKRESGIRISTRRQRHWNLSKIGVALAPENRSPPSIQIFQVAILRAQPRLKADLTEIAVAAGDEPSVSSLSICQPITPGVSANTRAISLAMDSESRR
jgi:hypothetical protein